MLVFAEAYLFCSFLTAWAISYGLQDETYGEVLHMALKIDSTAPLYETVRIMLCAPLLVWFSI
jgi:hypothetical protein